MLKINKIVKSERGMGKAQGFWGIHLYSEIILGIMK